MKQLFACAALLAVIGFASFLYRNTVERPGTSGSGVACTLEAKICPDGTSVGRQGPSCAFAACAHPNVEIPGSGIAFAVPEGYERTESMPGILAAFLAPGNHRIHISSYPIAEGQTGDEVILSNTRYQPADEGASDFSRFDPVAIRGRTFQSTVIERFEGMVMSSYFLVRENDVLRFDIIEHGVTGWMEPEFSADALPGHQAFRSMLSTLQTAP